MFAVRGSDAAAGDKNHDRQARVLHPEEADVMHGKSRCGNGYRNPVAVVQQQGNDNKYAEVDLYQSTRLLDHGGF